MLVVSAVSLAVQYAILLGFLPSVFETGILLLFVSKYLSMSYALRNRY